MPNLNECHPAKSILLFRILFAITTRPIFDDWPSTMIPVIIQDPIEQHIPAAGIVALKDAETGEEVICDTKSPAFQSAISSVLNSRKTRRDRMFKSIGVRPLNLSTMDEFIRPLQHYFKSR